MYERISINSEICHGKPCIKGTRIMVSIILGLLEEGMSFDQIIEEYPQITREDIIECIEYAKNLVENEIIEVIGATI